MLTTRRMMLRVVALALVAAPLTGCSYNTFVGQEEAVKSRWAEVQNQLQRRNDLIPNLVETVKGYAQHEEGVYKDIADARSRLLAAKSPEETIQAELYTAGMPDPDLVIRTAGEMRVSNFLLWQISYAELWVTERCWPEFEIEDFHQAIRDFAARDRRFGGL